MFRYSIKGKVTQAFILRGLLYSTGKDIDTYINESEVELIKTHCKIAKLTDLQATANSTPKAIPNNSKSKGVESDELPKSASAQNTNKISRKV